MNRNKKSDSKKWIITFNKWLITISVWVSSSFLSMVVMTACMIPVFWAHELSLTELFQTNSSWIAISLSLGILLASGIATFLSSYILLGHPTCYACWVFPITTISLFSNLSIFSLVVVPLVLGAIAGHYLNRYTSYRAMQLENTQPANFVSMRYAFIVLAILMTLALLPGHYHWSASLIWIAQLSLHLSAAAWGVWQRAEAKFAV